MLHTILLLYITFPSAEKAQEMSSHLLNKKLVGCTNSFPITSAYWWPVSPQQSEGGQGKIENDNEVVLLVKTVPNLEDRVRKEIEAHHPYQVPLIASWQVQVNEAYFKFMQEVIEN